LGQTTGTADAARRVVHRAERGLRVPGTAKEAAMTSAAQWPLAPGSTSDPSPASSWFDARTFHSAQWPLARALDAKGATTISVVLPALDEEATVGALVRDLRARLVDVERPLVDEIVVLDSGSTDATAQRAREAGARVVSREQAVPEIVPIRGKGEAMWRSLFATTGDIVVFLDADLTGLDPDAVAALAGPLLVDPSIDLVKGYYDRPMAGAGGDSSAARGDGGRVTELVARPLLNLHWPELSGLVQPLVGEYAARRSLLEEIPFACGYGVELAMLIDTLRLRGVDAIAQVDLGVRVHDHQSLRALGRMAAELWQVALDRLDRDGQVVLVQEPTTELRQFGTGAEVADATLHDVELRQRPPVRQIRGSLAPVR
jgi:glucosyl-3-phosphoglycerate synthase